MKTLAKNRIRSMIFRARQKEKESGYPRRRLVKDSDGCVDPSLFFEWACEVLNWDVLRAVAGLPKNGTSNSSGLPPIQASLGKVSVITVPDSYPQLKKVYIASVESNLLLQAENKALRAEMEIIRREQRKRRKKAAQGRMHGRKGKGIKKQPYSQ